MSEIRVATDPSTLLRWIIAANTRRPVSEETVQKLLLNAVLLSGLTFRPELSARTLLDRICQAWGSSPDMRSIRSWVLSAANINTTGLRPDWTVEALSIMYEHVEALHQAWQRRVDILPEPMHEFDHERLATD